MSSPAPSDANGDDAQRNELLADHADVLPGISDYVGDDAPLTAGQVSSGTIHTPHKKALTRNLTEQQYH